MASTKPCRLCNNAVDAKRTVQLFSATGYEHKWASRITALLLVQVDETDLLPSSVCNMCIRRLEFLEKAAADLQAFRKLARQSMSIYQSRGHLKRTRVTSSDVGVSPDTARERPSSKLARKKLVFSCKLIKVNFYKLVNKFWCNFSPRKVIVKCYSFCWKVHPDSQLCRPL